MVNKWTVRMNGEDYIMEENLHKWGIEKYEGERLNKIYCSIRKNIPSKIANPSKNLLLGFKFNL